MEYFQTTTEKTTESRERGVGKLVGDDGQREGLAEVCDRIPAGRPEKPALDTPEERGETASMPEEEEAEETEKLASRLETLEQDLYRHARKEYQMTNQGQRSGRKDVLDIAKECLDNLAQLTEDGKVLKDAYPPNERPRTAISANLKNYCRDPVLVSIDAIVLVAVWESRMGFHLPGDLVMTALYLNYLKHIFIRATQNLVSEFVRETETSGLVKKLIDQMDMVTAVGCETPRQKLLRFQTMGSHAIETRREGWREAILDSSPPTYVQGYDRWSSGQAREWNS